MSRLSGLLIAAIGLSGMLGAAAARGENEGQADLDKATQSKMTANSLSDLTEVIRLAQSALDKGLDKANRSFAESLLSSSLIQRGSRVAAEAGPAHDRKESNWTLYRKLALADLEKGVALDAKQPEALLWIAKLNVLEDGDAKRAAQAVGAAIKLLADEPLLRAEALVVRSRLRKDVKEKLADLDEAVRLAPKRAEAFRARGEARDDEGQLAPALEDLNRAIELEPNHWPSHQAKALVLAKMKKYDEAHAAIDKAIALAANPALPLLMKARIHVIQGNLRAAAEELDQADAAVPGEPAVLLLRAEVRQELGQKEKALTDVDRVLDRRPGWADALRVRASLLLSSQRLDDALDDLEKLRQQDPKDERVLLNLGMVYQATKKLDKAVEIYSDVLREHPDRWKFRRLRGDALMSLGKRAEAITDFNQALALQPKDKDTLNNLAWLLATAPEDKLRDGRRAVALATQACELTGYRQEYILSTLAAACAESGDFQGARKWSAKAVELGGKSKEYGDAMKKELAAYQAGKPWREALPEPEAKIEPKKGK